MFTSVGIVLRTHKNNYHKISLFDREHGHINCIVYNNIFSHGSLITYSLDFQRHSFFLCDVQFMCIPFGLAQQDLLFLHHVLEVIYYFVPIGSGFTGIFDLLAFLYTVEHIVISRKFKKFFMIKLLTNLAVVPEVGKSLSDSIADLNQVRIEQFHDDIMNDERERKVDKWLSYCIGHHPRVNDFKTVHFLEKHRVK
jgi:hypothetical protein